MAFPNSMFFLYCVGNDPEVLTPINLISDELVLSIKLKKLRHLVDFYSSTDRSAGCDIAHIFVSMYVIDKNCLLPHFIILRTM